MEKLKKLEKLKILPWRLERASAAAELSAWQYLRGHGVVPGWYKVGGVFSGDIGQLSVADSIFNIFWSRDCDDKVPIRNDRFHEFGVCGTDLLSGDTTWVMLQMENERILRLGIVGVGFILRK